MIEINMGKPALSFLDTAIAIDTTLSTDGDLKIPILVLLILKPSTPIMSYQYLQENYPILVTDRSLVAAMPAESVRDLKSDWAKKNAAPWNIDAAWNAIVDDLDAIASLEGKEDNDENDHVVLLSLLLEQKATPSRDRLLEIMKYDLGSFVELFTALSYVLLSDINVLPALLRSHHRATKTLVMRNKEKITAFFHEMVNPVIANETGKKPAVKKVAAKKAGTKSKKSSGSPLEERYGWNADDLFGAIDNDENAAMLLSLVSADDRDKFIRSYRVRRHPVMLGAVFDDGVRSESIITALIEGGDEKRVLQWISTLKREPLWVDENDSDNDDLGRTENKNLGLFDLIIQSRMEGAVLALTKLYDGDSQYEEMIIENIINDATISAVALRTIAAHYGDRMKNIWKDVDLRDPLRTTIVNGDIELLKALIDLTDILSIDSIVFHEDLNEEIHPLELALRMNAGPHLLDILVPHYNFDPYDVLYSIMNDLDDSEEWVETERGVTYLLNHYPFTERQLHSAIRRSTSVDKIQTVMDFLYPDLAEEAQEYHPPVYTLKEKNE